MVHAAGSTGHEADEVKREPTKVETGAKITKEALEKPEVAGKITGTLVKGGLELRKRAETAGTRQALAQELINKLTPEAQIAFIKDTQGFVHRMKEGLFNHLTMGGRSIWRLAAPTVAPNWTSLETFNEVELFAYLALGALDVEEGVASLVDSELKDDVKMLKVISYLCYLIPDIGVVLAEVFGGIAHLAGAPAEFLEKVLPSVREAVRNGGMVTETVATEHHAITDASSPVLDTDGTDSGMQAGL